MFIKRRIFTLFAVLVYLSSSLGSLSFADELAKPNLKHPDYAHEYLGEDKYENFNRKIFVFNSKLNKWVLRPVHIVWASIMPKYGMDRIQSAYNNIEYPKRLVSSLIQRDFKATKSETIRFLTNSTIGLGGLYDPAKSLLKIEPAQESMDQALAKCKVKQGPYLVMPGISSTTPRGMFGKLLEWPLEPTLYFASPVTIAVKAGLLVNKTSYMQPIVKMIESTYADPYDIAKKLYGIESYIRNSNLDRKEVLDTEVQIYDEMVKRDVNAEFITFLEKERAMRGEPPQAASEHSSEVVDKVAVTTGAAAPLAENKSSAEHKNTLATKTGVVGGIPAKTGSNATSDKIAINDSLSGTKAAEDIIATDGNVNPNLIADIMLQDYKPQGPVTDSLRTALFEVPDINDSMWSELSVWNRSFAKRIKTSSVNVDPSRDNYKYRYIMQKDKDAPVAILFPSIGEGITTHHSVVLAKIFYDEGYSVVMQGSHFHWEFVKSMPAGYKPGLPSQDMDYLKIVTSKILTSLQDKYDCKFSEKVVVGTSFGAMATLFLADKEAQNNTMNIIKFISINPPIELLYALRQIDKNNEEWHKNPANLKHRVAVTAAKIIQISQSKGTPDEKINAYAFSEEEAKLITGFMLHQKLSDLIFTIEETSKSKKANIYEEINNMNYRDYAEKYIVKEKYNSYEEMDFDTSLHSIAGYLQNNDNYKIYHTVDDYLVSQQQLKKLKEYSNNKIVFLNNGSHLGFLYRKEFQDELKKDIAQHKPEEMISTK